MGTRGQTLYIKEVGLEDNISGRVIFELEVSWQFGSEEKESGLECYSSNILFQSPQDT